MAYIQEKAKGKKIVSFKIKACLGAGCQWQANLQVYNLVSPCGTHPPAKARKEAQKVAARWEEEQRLAFSQQKAEEEPAPPAPVYTFDTFVNEVWIPPSRNGLYQCWLWKKNRGMEAECQFEITAKSIEYRWNEILPDREW